MNTFKIAATRRVGLFVVLLAASAVAAPAFAACNPGAFNVNPKSQTNILEYNAGAGYARVLVTLGINKSLSADGATAVWTQIGGPAVTLNTSNPQNPTFLTPDVPSAGATLTFRLTVTCGGSQASDTGTVSIIDVNRPPVAFAQAAPAIVYEGNTVTLTSTGTNDPDSDTLLYTWSRTAGPAVTLANAAAASTTFVAPTTGANYTLQFQLLVRDRATGGLTSTANVVVNVTHNLPPLAKLSCPTQVNEHGHVVLDGSASYDPNGGPLTYLWTQLQGSPAISVGSETGSTVQFDAPALTTGQDGFVQFQLKATDSTGLWDLATCMMQIVDITAPVISVPAAITAEADSAGGKAVSYSVYAQDAVDDAAPYLLACAPPSGSTFPLAPAPARQNTSIVACTAHDSAVRAGFPTGNVANAGFNITVRDTTPPVITVPGALGLEATGPTGAISTFSATTADAVDGAGIAICAPASGSTFALATTLVTCNATDARNNAATAASFNLTVHDTTNPVVTPPADVIAEATGPLTVVAFGTATATDAVGVVSIVNDGPATFALGTTTIHWTAKDAAGNVGKANSLVTVQDKTPPAIDAHAAITGVEATSAAGAIVDYVSPATHDLVDGIGTAVCAPLSGSTFALGTHAVTCNATDTRGNSTVTSTTFDVTVVDTTPPTIDAHAAILGVEATGSAGAAVTYDSPATHDFVDGTGTAVCTPLSGATFALGTHPVTCHATDAHGNATIMPTTFDVTVVDTTAPTIDAHDPITGVEATGSAGAAVTYASSATHDFVDGTGTAVCTPLSGATFALGTHPVTCHATDAHGNTTIPPTTFDVTVVDTTPPTIEIHGDVGPIEATSAGGAIVTYDAPASSDLVDGPGTANCSPLSGAQFALGDTTVACAALDHANNAADLTYFKVKVRDTTAPVIAIHADITAEATGSAGAIVTYLSPATSDAVDGPGLASCLPASGDTFSLGEHMVTCHAHDAAGNDSTATHFTITVVDTTPPTIDVHDAISGVEATGSAGAAVTYASSATHDLVDGTGTAVCTPLSGATFALGTHPVTCHATDAHGNTTIPPTTFDVTVVDTTPPTIEIHGNVGPIEATSAAGAIVTYTASATSDAVDGPGAASCSPLSDSQFALGNTTVACAAVDQAHNVATITYFKVLVHDTTAPIIAAHGDITAEATGPTGAIVSYVSPATTDAVDGGGFAGCLPASGDTFALGAHTVTCNAVDAADNHSTPTTFDVTVVDTTSPVVTPPADVTTEATGQRTTVDYGKATAADAVGVESIVSNAPADFPVGTTTIAWTATDAAGNAGHANSRVTVTDKTPPLIAFHGDVGPVEASGAGGAIATYIAPVTSDLVDGAGIASCSPLSGTQFALGDTTVACAAVDHAHNAAVVTYFRVMVRDNTAPVIASHVDITAEATGPTGVAVSYASPATTDAVDGSSSASCLPVSGSTFSLGPHSVTCNAHDAAGNASTATSFTITVRDTTAPTIAPHADVNVTATGNSSALVSYTLPTATDLVDVTVPVTCTPASGTTFTVGSTTVNCSATDHAGNTTASSFKVIVSYGFSGFFRPVDNLPVVNVVKAGSAIPVKFSLGGDQGLNIFASGYPASMSTSCTAAPTDAIEETVTAGGSSLSYDPISGQYIYVWKTDKSWIGCRQLQVKLRDGSSRWAAFSFTR